jgi:Bacterial Ig-like domain (group 2)
MTKCLYSTKVFIIIPSLFLLAILAGCNGGDVQVKPGEGAYTGMVATPTSISITPVSPSIVNGSSKQFVATGTFLDNTTQNLTTQVTWSSSNTDVATINPSGLATSIAAGSTTITATWGSMSESTTLTVTLTGSATLAWDAPTTYEDGTPVTDLAGFKIYYGTSSGNYTSIIDVGNITTYVINTLASGTYYFAVTAYYTSGNQSGYSNEASKTIQ